MPAATDGQDAVILALDTRFPFCLEVCSLAGVKLPLTELFTGHSNDYYGRQTFGQEMTAT